MTTHFKKWTILFIALLAISFVAAGTCNSTSVPSQLCHLNLTGNLYYKNCTINQTLVWNGTTFDCGNQTGTSGGITNVTSGTGIIVTNLSIVSLNTSYTDGLYILLTNEANLNVNSSIYWNGISTFDELDNTHIHSFSNISDISAGHGISIPYDVMGGWQINVTESDLNSVNRSLTCNFADSVLWSGINDSSFPSICPNGTVLQGVNTSNVCVNTIDNAGYALTANSSEYWDGLNTPNDFVNINASGNITANGYFMGQPLLGMLGSGLISSPTGAGSYFRGVNVTCTGLSCSWNNFTMRIMKGDASAFATYCNVVNGSYTVTDNEFNLLYVRSSDCTVQLTTYDTWFTTLMNQGGAWDFGYILTQAGSTEVIDSNSLEQRRMMKQRVLNYYTQQSKVVSGFGFQANGLLSFNITDGKTVFGMDVVPVNKHIVVNATNHIEAVGHGGSASNWSNIDQTALNVSHCDNGTAIVACTGTGFRRIFIFSIGYDDAPTVSELHQTFGLLGTTYVNSGQCLDTVTNPLTYTLPNNYLGANVMLYAYCAQRTTTAIDTTKLIDLRTVKTGSASGGTDISGLVPYTGAVNNLNLGNFNVTASYSTANSSWTHQSYPAACSAGNAITQLGDSTVCTAFLQNVVEDTTPQLGGALDAQNKNITAVSCIVFQSGGKICDLP